MKLAFLIISCTSIAFLIYWLIRIFLTINTYGNSKGLTVAVIVDIAAIVLEMLAVAALIF